MEIAEAGGELDVARRVEIPAAGDLQRRIRVLHQGSVGAEGDITGITAVQPVSGGVMGNGT